MTAFSSAVSVHPIPATAVGEVCGEIIEKLTGDIDLAFITLTSPFVGTMEDIAKSIRALLKPRVMLISCTTSVIGTNQEIDGSPAISLWCATDLKEIYPFSSVSGTIPTAEQLGFLPAALLLLGEPRTFDYLQFFKELAEVHPTLGVVGGYCPIASTPASASLWMDEFPRATGAIGVFIGTNAKVALVTSQGCTQIGQPYIITKMANTNEILELGGKSALARLTQLNPLARALELEGSVEIGLVIDESKATFDEGDFLIRPIIGANPEAGSIIIGESVRIGTTVQFHVRDRIAATENLTAALLPYQARSALIFSCNGRGPNFFGIPSPDARMLADRFGTIPVGGMAAAGEFGPVGQSNFLHSFTATMVLFK